MRPKKLSGSSKELANSRGESSPRLQSLKVKDNYSRAQRAMSQQARASSSLSSTLPSFSTTSVRPIRDSAHTCAGCNKPIRRDKYLLKACDKYWHENCLKCDKCQNRLGELGSTLYCKSNMNLCRRDYLEMFGKTGVCSACEKLICASEMVMRAKENVYHLECFACQLCNQRFCVGDRFYLCENKVVCQYDYEEHILPIQSYLLEQAAAKTDIDSTSKIEINCLVENTGGDQQTESIQANSDEQQQCSLAELSSKLSAANDEESAPTLAHTSESLTDESIVGNKI